MRSLLLLLLCLGSTVITAAELEVKVLSVKGTVLYKKVKSSQWLKLKVNDQLAENHVIRTKERSSATLEVGGKALFRIHEFSYVRLEKLSRKEKDFDIKLQLPFGRLVNRFKKNEAGEKSTMSVGTPVAVAAVRGTSFELDASVDRQRASVGVWDGKVEVRSADGKYSKMLGPLEKLIVLYNKPLDDPIKMRQQEINREREFQQDLKNLGVAQMFPAASGILELNTMETNKARDIVNRNRKIMVGGKQVRKDFDKLKQAIALLYADTKFNPGYEVSGKMIKNMYAKRSLDCLIKNADRSGKAIKNWNGPYIDSDLKDPFGSEYGVYLQKTRKNEFLVIYSLGVDKRPNRYSEKALY